MNSRVTKVQLQKKGNFSVYQLTFPSGKFYFGITSRDVSARVKQHVGDAKRGSTLLVHKAMRAYGFNFKTEVIYQAVDKDSAIRIEKRLIYIFDSIVKNGYNLTPGGELPSSCVNFKPFFSFCQRTKKKAGPFSNITEACRALGVTDSLVARCLSCVASSHKGYVFYRTDQELAEKLLKCKKTFKETIVVTLPCGKFVGEWSNIKQCALDLGLKNTRDIREVLTNDKRKTHKNYCFAYKG